MLDSSGNTGLKAAKEIPLNENIRTRTVDEPSPVIRPT